MVDYTSQKYRKECRKKTKNIKSLVQRDEIVKKIVGSMGKVEILELGCGENSLFSDSVKVDIAKIKGCMQVDCNKPLPINRKFDVIVSLDLIEHLLETDIFLEECKRLLKQDGLLILSTPNVMNICNRLGMIIDDGTIDRYFNGTFEFGHVRYFTPKSLKKTLEKHNFTVERIIPLGKIRLVNLCGGFVCLAKR